ncbi:hypothetical protein FOCC_FOCC016288 [Frankliniella occidentalis]|nr:hypothetical protein FOCC_FOCC016288 [Frankliniella occidentalis]
MFLTLLDPKVVPQDENLNDDHIKEKCIEFLISLAEKYPDPVPQEIEGTSEQASTDLWKKERRFRAVASKGQRIVGLLSHRSTWSGKISFLQEHVWGMDDKIRDLPAFKYGTKHEPTARDHYQEKIFESGLLVLTTGMWVNGKYPQLSCSPDGFVGHVEDNCNFKITKLLEIKCPITMEAIRPQDFDNHLTRAQLSAHYLKRESDGSISLKQSSSYYFQVQMNMALIEVHECDFVVWSPLDILIIPILFDKDFWSEKLPKIVSSHRKILLPEYFAARARRNLRPLILDY